jgi:hypothetical protein
MGFSHRQIVLVYYLFSAFFGAIALVTASRLFKFVALLVMIGLVAGGFALVNWRSKRQIASFSAVDQDPESS